VLSHPVFESAEFTGINKARLAATSQSGGVYGSRETCEELLSKNIKFQYKIGERAGETRESYLLNPKCYRKAYQVFMYQEKLPNVLSMILGATKHEMIFKPFYALQSAPRHQKKASVTPYSRHAACIYISELAVAFRVLRLATE
jgi:hypothetical protein